MASKAALLAKAEHIVSEYASVRHGFSKGNVDALKIAIANALEGAAEAAAATAYNCIAADDKVERQCMVCRRPFASRNALDRHFVEKHPSAAYEAYIEDGDELRGALSRQRRLLNACLKLLERSECERAARVCDWLRTEKDISRIVQDADDPAIELMWGS